MTVKQGFRLNSSPPSTGTIPSSTSTSDVLSFHRQLPGYNPADSPLISLPELARKYSVKNIFIKDESRRCGLPAFKILGASWGTYRAILDILGVDVTEAPSLNEVAEMVKQQPVSLFAATEGNHGRAAAFMAGLINIDAHIYVPHDLDQHTKDQITNQGAKLHESVHYDQACKDAEAGAKAEKGGILVQDTAWEGYEDIPRWIVQGYQTIFTEIDMSLDKQNLATSHIFVPIGVGSLGHAAVKHYRSEERKQTSTPDRPPAQLIAVEPESAACLLASVQAGKLVTIETQHTIMNGMNCGTCSSSPWPDLRDHINAYMTVNEWQAHRAVEELATQDLQAGPCGAAGLAAFARLSHEERRQLAIDDDSVVVFVCTEGWRPYDIPVDDGTA